MVQWEPWKESTHALKTGIDVQLFPNNTIKLPECSIRLYETRTAIRQFYAVVNRTFSKVFGNCMNIHKDFTYIFIYISIPTILYKDNSRLGIAIMQ